MITILVRADNKDITINTFQAYSDAYNEMKNQFDSVLKESPADCNSNIECCDAAITCKNAELNVRWKIQKAADTIPANDRLAQIRLEHGTLLVDKALDPQYPGVDVEYVPDDDDKRRKTRPRVLIEQPENENLRVLVWADPKSEDYSDEIEFENTSERS